MTNEEILKKAIEKAIKNGYIYPESKISSHGNEVRSGKMSFGQYYERNGLLLSVESIIFSHEFVKAFWGEEIFSMIRNSKETAVCNYESLPLWQYHIQKMVLEKNPIKYLAKFL